MRKLALVVAALVASLGAIHAAADAPQGMPDCPGTVVWVNYPNASGPGCDVNPPQVLHVRYLPSTWTLAQAHTYCTGLGADGAYTRYANTANVCPDIDY